MKQMTSALKQQQLEWRRANVLELSSEGYTQREIASKLQVDLAAVNRDIQFLRQQAQQNLQKHIHETVPEEYQKCMVGLKRNLKQTLEIAETVSDPKTKLRARAVANDCYKYIMDLTTNGVVVTDAIKYVQGKMDHLNGQEKAVLQDIKEKEDQSNEPSETQEDKETINRVF
jgi:DNA-binding transcriptional regulator LsrR (DeoR family)